MRGGSSAYSALGLEPGADRGDVERAYKRLIKQHHPDREGGDATRAAEINRAYRELRERTGLHDALVLTERAPPHGREWLRVGIAMVLALVVLVLLGGPLAAYMRQLSQPPRLAGNVAPARPNEPASQPIDAGGVNDAISDAVRIAASGDEGALLDRSRDCHRRLRLKPSMAQLDRCAAFDDAVVALQDRDPMWDRGPFSQISVTGRQWSAGTGLSNDYLAIDSRLDRIRVYVELALARPDPPRIPARQVPELPAD